MFDDSYDVFTNPDFLPEQFAQNVAQKCVGLDELIKHKRSLEELLLKTNDGLKKSVYNNFMKFIHISKEITYLGNEMKQLSQLLNEQTDLLSTISHFQILKDDNKNGDLSNDNVLENQNSAINLDANRIKLLQEIIDAVEECPNLLEFENCHFLNDEKLLELHPLENTPLRRIHAYLFSRHLMICSVKSNRNNSTTHKFQSIYDLESLAVINIKEMGNIKAAFKIISFPETRVFQCVSAATKKKWIELLDSVKKSLSHEQKNGNLVKIEREENTLSESESAHSTTSLDLPNETMVEIHHPDWFIELPDDLDVLIAQRQFDDAFSLLNKSHDYVQKNSTTYINDIIFNDITKKIEDRRTILVLSLKHELSPNRSLHSDLRLMRKPIRLLNHLNASSDACQLFLHQCTCILKQHYKRIKRDSSTFVYVQQLSILFSNNLSEITDQFHVFFKDVLDGENQIEKSYTNWASKELNVFAKYFNEEVFTSQNLFSSICDCVIIVRNQIKQMKTNGVFLLNEFDEIVTLPLKKSIQSTHLKLLETYRSFDDDWKSMNLVTKLNLNRILQEFQEIGFQLHPFVSDNWIHLTSYTLFFVKTCTTYLLDCLKLELKGVVNDISESLLNLFEFHLEHLKSATESQNNSLVQKNVIFCFDQILPKIEEIYESKMTIKIKNIDDLKEKFRYLRPKDSNWITYV